MSEHSGPYYVFAHRKGQVPHLFGPYADWYEANRCAWANGLRDLDVSTFVVTAEHREYPEIREPSDPASSAGSALPGPTEDSP